MKFRINVSAAHGYESHESRQCVSREEALREQYPEATIRLVASCAQFSLFDCTGEDGTIFEARVFDVIDGSERMSSVPAYEVGGDEPTLILWADYDAMHETDNGYLFDNVRVRLSLPGTEWVSVADLSDENGFYVDEDEIAKTLMLLEGISEHVAEVDYEYGNPSITVRA